jgi:hypothetical protein
MVSPSAYTGAWRSQATFVDRALDPAPGVDPAHLYMDAPEAGSRPPSGAPMMDLGPPYLSDNEDGSIPWDVETNGLVLDTEPVTHEEEISTPVPSPMHAVNRGAVARYSYQQPIMRSIDERYETTRTENLPVTGDLTPAVLRGDNSLPQNNPDGYRNGWTVWRRMNRPMFGNNGNRRYDERLLRAMTAAAAVQSPAPERANRYQSPFSWNKFNIGTRLNFPMQRRDPPAWDESTLTDGLDNQQDIPTWVVD